MPETTLVVEDEPALRDTLTYNLKKDGFTVEAVGDGRLALETVRIRRQRPDRLGGGLDVPLPDEVEFFCHVGGMGEVGRILPRNDCERVNRPFHFTLSQFLDIASQ